MASLAVTRLRRNPIGLFAKMQHAQGDRARLRFGSRTLLLISHPEDVQRVLVTEEHQFPRGQLYKSWRRPSVVSRPDILLGPGADPGFAVSVLDCFNRRSAALG